MLYHKEVMMRYFGPCILMIVPRYWQDIGYSRDAVLITGTTLPTYSTHYDTPM